MLFIRLANQLLLGAIAFSVGSIFGMVVHRNGQRGLLTGLVAVPACYSAATIVNRRQRRNEQQIYHSLDYQIQLLEEEETQLYETLASAESMYQELEASVSALQLERSQLLSRISELHQQRNALNQELHRLQQQRYQQEEWFTAQQTQLQHLEKQKLKLEQTLDLQLTQLKPAELRLQNLQKEFKQVESGISAKQLQQREIEASLANMAGRKDRLVAEVQYLKSKLEELVNTQETLMLSFVSLEEEKQELENSITDKKQELMQQQELLNRSGVKSEQLEGILPEEWQEWLQFYQQLSDEKKQVFRAILARDEAMLKQIADRQATMTEVVIDSLNETAISQFGDTVFVRSESLIPDIYEEYSQALSEPTSIYLKDLLDKKHEI